jgi:hypothetical protein
MKELEGCTFSPHRAATGPRGNGNKSSRSRSRSRGGGPDGSGESGGGGGYCGGRGGAVVVVRGLGRYLETRDLAKKLRDEKAAAEAKAARGWVSGKGRPQTGTTQPQPFNLSGPRDPTAKAKLARDAEDRERSSCTFHPRTNESVGRAVAGALLDDDEAEVEGSEAKEGCYEEGGCEGGGDAGNEWEAGGGGHSKAAALPGYDLEDFDGGYGAKAPSLGGYADFRFGSYEEGYDGSAYDAGEYESDPGVGYDSKGYPGDYS